MTSLEQQATPKHRMALYGGSFDPVHLAHLSVARAALEQAALDQVVFIPSAHSPLKKHGPVARDSDRLKMLELALGDEPGFSVDDMEIRRGGVSFSSETIQAYREKRPDAELFWIVGADQFIQLDLWRHIEDLVRIISFLVLKRPGFELNPPVIPGLIWAGIDAPLMDVSSTVVREGICCGYAIEGLLPQTVETFIRENGLYT